MQTSYWIRNINARYYLEMFMISAAGTVLAIRIFLHLTGYPQIGGGTLHIAHMLWGGLLMLVAIIMLQTYLNKTVERLAVVLGGIGFGAFIDEVGKFVTQDNNYFFQPSFALMYVVFMVLYLSVDWITSRKNYTGIEYQINTLKEMYEIFLHDFDDEEKNRVVSYLAKAQLNPKWRTALELIVHESPVVDVAGLRPYRRIRKFIRARYRVLATNKLYAYAITVFFVGRMLISTSYVLYSLITGADLKIDNFRTIDWIILGSSTISSLFVLIGVARIWRNRLSALLNFRGSLLISVFITQIFLFYRDELGAFGGFMLDLVFLAAITFMIEREKSDAAPVAAT